MQAIDVGGVAIEFVGLSGELDVFVHDAWTRVGPGDVLHIPGGTKHTLVNRGHEPSVVILVSTAKIGRFFREVAGGSVEHFLATSERYGYWNATPEENAAVSP